MQLIGALGVFRHLLEDHRGMGVHDMARDGIASVGWGIRGRRLPRGRRLAIRPWPDQEAYEGKDGAANETLAIYFWQSRGTDVHRNFRSRRRAAMAI